MGEIDAHYNLSLLYEKGEGVEKGVKKDIYLPEEAAMGGHPDAKYNLGCYEWKNERIDRAVNHLIIAANLGFDKSIQRLQCDVQGHVSKEEFAVALRAHQAAVG